MHKKKKTSLKMQMFFFVNTQENHSQSGRPLRAQDITNIDKHEYNMNTHTTGSRLKDVYQQHIQDDRFTGIVKA